MSRAEKVARGKAIADKLYPYMEWTEIARRLNIPNQTVYVCCMLALFKIEKAIRLVECEKARRELGYGN